MVPEKQDKMEVNRCHYSSAVEELRWRENNTFVQAVSAGRLFHWNAVKRLVRRVSTLQVRGVPAAIKARRHPTLLAISERG